MRFILTTLVLACLLSHGRRLTLAAPVPQPVGNETRAEAPLKVYNRTVAVFRTSFMGVSAAERALRAKESLGRLLAKGSGAVTYQNVPQGYTIMVGGVQAFLLVPEDADPLAQETAEQAARKVVFAIEQVVAETREAHNMTSMLHAVGRALVAITLLLCVAVALHRLRALLIRRMTTIAGTYAEKLSIEGESVFHPDRILSLIRRSTTLVYWAVTALLSFNCIGYVLAQFPYTKPWGEQLTGYLLNVARNFTDSIVGAIPGIVIAILIFLIARMTVNFLKAVFDRIERGGGELFGLDRDTVRPTRRVASAIIWLFAMAMAYPYLPGAQTEAFKGLSVMVGLMVSLGGASLVGQAASGLILMYTRTVRAGDFVHIAESEGTVVEVGLFATRIRTGLGEELTLPNALILGNTIRNYSRSFPGVGYVVDTSVTIGYDAPWRQVHAMMIEAAHRTSGVAADPPPEVFQTALSDFYPNYRLVCRALAGEPRSRAALISELHANIQDVFNEYGVQIMSPHYLGDPAEPKVVPPDLWAPPPARQDRVKPSSSTRSTESV